MASGQQMIPDEQFYRLVELRTGLVLTVHQRTDVAALLDGLNRSSPDPQFHEVLPRLSEYPLSHPLWQRIVQSITVGETYFFRNQAQFDALRSHVLPALINERRKTGSKQLRLWSAGSATGEEAYSLAILLREMLPDIEAWAITILATDINTVYLEQARQGVYRARSFRNETPEEVRDRWFVPERDGYSLKSTIRNMVIFESLNLTSDEYPTFESSTMFMDVILCRNVTIYFDQQTTRLIVRRFHKALNQNGWLVVGHSEPQADMYQGFAARNFKDTVLYQKENSDLPQARMTSPTPSIPDPLTLPSVPITRRRSSPSLPMKQPKPAPEPFSTADFWVQAKQAADLGKQQEAREWLDKAEQQNQFRPEVHYLRALVELDGGNFDQAFQLLRQAIYCDSSFALAHYTLGDLYQRRGAQKEAARHWQAALDAVENRDLEQTLPYSDDLTIEMFIQLLATRLFMV